MFDTKAGITAQIAKAKAEALQKYIKNQPKKGKNLFGGIVIHRNNTFYLNQKDIYDWSKCEKDNWEDWTIIDF